MFWANLITFSLQGADGVNIDLEWPPVELRGALTAFTCELSALLRRTVHACNPIQALLLGLYPKFDYHFRTTCSY